MSRFVRLKHQDGIFRDPQTGFKVSLRDVAELTEPVGVLTKRWLTAGGLVEVDPPGDENVGALLAAPSDAPAPEAPMDAGTAAEEVQPADDAEEPPVVPMVLKRKPRKRK